MPPKPQAFRLVYRAFERVEFESVQRLGEWERDPYDRLGRYRLEYQGWRGCCS